MVRSTARLRLALLAGALLAAPGLHAQAALTHPPDGDNQRAEVSQWIGPVKVTVDYNSPDVHSPSGEDRSGKIWGALVPYGMANLGFGTCGDQCPWRGGANENTVLTVSHDVEIQGKPLAAGAYGVHFVPGADEWTVIFSRNSTSWGSFFYDVKEDALRVQAKPEKNPYHEWLTYEFTDRQPDKATVALMWENLKLPVTVAVPDIKEVYFQAIERELRTDTGFQWQAWNTAANYTLDNKIHLDQGLRWAQHGVDAVFVGEANFTTLVTLSELQQANGQGEEARKTFERALAQETANATAVHQYARGLQGRGENDRALQVFEQNAKRHPDAWPTELGLARGYQAVGQKDEALKHARLALGQAPDDPNRKAVQGLIAQLEGGTPK
jgi:hypothetical protein